MKRPARTCQFPWEIPRTTPPRMTRSGELLIEVGACAMRLPLDMAWTHFEDGTYYERNVTAWLETLLVRLGGRVFYDIGANYGYFSLLLAHRAAQIHAFEPVSATRRMLRANLRRNRLTSVKIHPVAVSDHRGRAEINIYGASGKNSLFAMSRAHTPHLGTESVRLATLDDLLAAGKIEPPDLVKIDVEGGELAALRGARALLARHQPVLVLEYLEYQFKDAGYRRRDLLRELARHDYRVFGIPEDYTDLRAYLLTDAGGIEIASIIAAPPHKARLVRTPAAMAAPPGSRAHPRYPGGGAR